MPSAVGLRRAAALAAALAAVGSLPAAAAPLPAAVPRPVAEAPLTMAFAGDVHFEAHVAALLRRPGTALTSLRPHLATADLAMVNLETAITTRGTPAPKQYRFRAPATALSALAGAGVDVVTMANNHAVDFGPVGLTDTLAARKAGPVRVVGIGANAAQAYAPAVLTVRGRRVAFLGASQIGDWTLRQWGATSARPGIAGARPLDRLVTAVKEARAQADVVVVYLHWGTERLTCPDAAQRAAAAALAAAGADVIVGAHAHRLQGAGWLGRSFVAYGLGNFVWYNRSSEASTTTGVLTLTLHGRRVTRSRWTPLRIGATGVPTAPPKATADRLNRAFQSTRGCTGLSPQPPA